MRRSSVLALSMLLWVTQASCTPRCQRVCDKLLECGIDTERIAQDECEASCNAEADLYETWEDTSKEKAFNEHRRCIMRSTCDEIADGACYDPELFIFAEE